MSQRVRAFMAVLLPEDLKRSAWEVQEQMRREFPEGSIRWVAPENFHLTLRFFGDLDAKACAKAGAVVEQIDGAFGSLAVRISGASAFPSPTRPQTLWLALQDENGGLERLAQEVDRRIRQAGFGPPDKPWKSHLTVGRVGRNRALRCDPEWSARLTWSREVSTIETIALMQSELRPQGPKYSPLRTASASPRA